jgi:hypothetical protein
MFAVLSYRSRCLRRAGVLAPMVGATLRHYDIRKFYTFLVTTTFFFIQKVLWYHAEFQGTMTSLSSTSFFFVAAVVLAVAIAPVATAATGPGASRRLRSAYYYPDDYIQKPAASPKPCHYGWLARMFGYSCEEPKATPKLPTYPQPHDPYDVKVPSTYAEPPAEEPYGGYGDDIYGGYGRGYGGHSEHDYPEKHHPVKHHADEDGYKGDKGGYGGREKPCVDHPVKRRYPLEQHKYPQHHEEPQPYGGYGDDYYPGQYGGYGNDYYPEDSGEHNGYEHPPYDKHKPSGWN